MNQEVKTIDDIPVIESLYKGFLDPAVKKICK